MAATVLGQCPRAESIWWRGGIFFAPLRTLGGVEAAVHHEALCRTQKILKMNANNLCVPTPLLEVCQLAVVVSSSALQLETGLKVEQFQIQFERDYSFILWYGGSWTSQKKHFNAMQRYHT